MPHLEAPIYYQQGDLDASSLSSASSGNHQLLLNNYHNHHQQDEQHSLSPSSSIASDLIDPVDIDPDLDQPYLFPIVIPPEPTLNELLKRVTGREDLHNVDTLKVRVISCMVSLSQLAVFMPRLTTLDLNGSVLNSLRELGCGLIHLSVLNISNCGLSSLDGTNGLTSLHTLIADDNRIESINPLGNLILLQKLSLKNNKIKSTGILSFLALCPLIKDISLEGNPVTSLLTYRKDMRKNIATLEILDGVDIHEDVSNTENSSNNIGCSSNHPSSLSLEDASSLSEETDENVEMPLQNLNLTDRPSTSNGHSHTTVRENLPIRPGTADCIRLRNSLTSQGPIHRSIIETARKSKKIKVKTAWRRLSSSSSSSSNNSSCLESIHEKTFTDHLPQSSVDLELGVIGMCMKSPRNTEISPSSSSSSASLNSFHEIAKKWRLEINREKISNNNDNDCDEKIE